MSKTRKILITGSGGFILGNFIRQVFYSKKPYAISSIDKVRESHIIHNIYVNADHQFYIADIKDSHILHVIFQKERPDIVIHGAGESSTNNGTLSLTANNVIGTQNVIDECIKSNSRLIYISTDKVYGDLDSDQAAADETATINPKNLYAATKASGELLVKAAHGLNYNIVRASSCYGPWQFKDKLIPGIISSILNDKDINIYGKGDQLRDWLHVFDMCKALFQIIDNAEPNETYNVTAKQEFMNIEVAQIICNILGKGHDLIKHVEDKLGHSFRYASANDKIKSIGWVPEFKFRDGIKDTCQWFFTNKYVLDL